MIATLPYCKADKSGRKGDSSSEVNHCGLGIDVCKCCGMKILLWSRDSKVGVIYTCRRIEKVGECRNVLLHCAINPTVYLNG